MAVVEWTALALADKFRCGKGTASPFELWQAANRDCGGVRVSRIERYRHAMIHAGYLTTAKGASYKRCPMCHEKLR